jgi:hypothetical protein
LLVPITAALVRPDAALDMWVWISLATFLVLLASRAWVVETGRRQLGGTPTKVRALTIASGVMLSVVLVLFMTQGGALLVQALVTGNDPIALLGGTDDQPVPNGQDPADAGGQAPAAGQAPEGAAPAAPAGG